MIFYETSDRVRPVYRFGTAEHFSLTALKVPIKRKIALNPMFAARNLLRLRSKDPINDISIVPNVLYYRAIKYTS